LDEFRALHHVRKPDVFQQQIVSRQKRTEEQRRIIKEANPSWTVAISSLEKIREHWNSSWMAE